MNIDEIIRKEREESQAVLDEYRAVAIDVLRQYFPTVSTGNWHVISFDELIRLATLIELRKLNDGK